MSRCSYFLLATVCLSAMLADAPAGAQAPVPGGNIQINPRSAPAPTQFEWLPGNDQLPDLGIRAPGAATGGSVPNTMPAPSGGSTIIIDKRKTAPSDPGYVNADTPHAKRKEADPDDHLIPYKYQRYNAQGLYQPWTNVPDLNYWYGSKFHAWMPGSRTIYHPKWTNPYFIEPPKPGSTVSAETLTQPLPPGFSPSGPAVESVLPRSAPVHMQLPPAAATSVTPPAMPTNGMFHTGTIIPGPTPHMAPIQPGCLHPGPYPTGAGPIDPLDPGFNDVNYRPRHAGSYSPYVGYYGYGGRTNYGYGPYNYIWAGGYSGFGRNGSFNYWLPQSGLQW